MATHGSMNSLDVFREDKSLFTLNDLSFDDLKSILQKAWTYKWDNSIRQHAKNKTLALYFEKKSTRTRLSCAVAWTKLGGNVVDLSPGSGSHIASNEGIYDSFRVIADMADCVVVRVHDDMYGTIERALADSNKKPPLINGLSSSFHPLQALADVFTMYECVQPDSETTDKATMDVSVLKGKTFCWIGDGNNVANSLVTTLPRFGMNVRVCTPKKYELHPDIMQRSKMHLCPSCTQKSEEEGNLIKVIADPREAVCGADFIATDTWVSMGDESEKKERLAAFDGYRIDENLVSKVGKDDWYFMHCLPRKQEEVSDQVFYGPHSVVFAEAENRMWTVLALFSGIIE